MNTDHDDQHDELARRLQTVMRDHDHEAPAPGAMDVAGRRHELLLDTDRVGAVATRGARRRRLALPSLAAAAAVVAAASLVATSGGGSSSQQAMKASPTVSTPSTRTIKTPPPVVVGPTTTATYGGKIEIVPPPAVPYIPVQFRGLQLLYPGLGGRPCVDTLGTFTTGPFNTGSATNCLHADDPKRPSLIMAATDATPAIDISAATEPTTIDGHPALTGRRGSYDYIVVPSLKTVARFYAGSPTATERALRTASIVSEDPYGCPLRVDNHRVTRPTVPGSDVHLIPGTPVRALDCLYTGSDAATPGVAMTLTQNPSTTQSAVNALTRTTTACAPDMNDDRHVFYMYADGTVLDLRIRMTSCKDTQITNGSITRVGTQWTVPPPV